MSEDKVKKDAKTRTSITIDPAILDRARKAAETAGESVSALIERAVRSELGPESGV